MRTEQEQRSDLLFGRNAILEALKAEREINTIVVAEGDKSGSLLKIMAAAKDRGVPVKFADSAKLETLTGSKHHQGVMAYVAAHRYAELEDVFSLAEGRGEALFVLIADEIEDPHNLGALIRTAEACGVHGLIVPKRRSVGLTPVVAKTSAGAIEHLPVVRVSNIVQTIELLKKRGVWVYGTDMQGTLIYEADFSGPIALVIGSEGKGLSRLTKEKCDDLFRLPMLGEVSSLNASVAGGVFMYEIVRQRLGGSQK